MVLGIVGADDDDIVRAYPASTVCEIWDKPENLSPVVFPPRMHATANWFVVFLSTWGRVRYLSVNTY